MSADAATPILLVHGIARFDWLREQLAALAPFDRLHDEDRLHYFRGIRSHLRHHGCPAAHASLSYAAPSRQRAEELGRQVEGLLRESGAAQVHLFAHSMGGLDARRLLVDRPELARRVASLTTLGTPHLGSSFADWAFERGGQKLIQFAGPVLDLAGFADLAQGACAEFNAEHEAAEAANGVRYRTVASHSRREETFLPLRASWDILAEREGDNDGLVSVASQRWTANLESADGRRKPVEQLTFPFPADHLNQVGWWDPSKASLGEGIRTLPERIEAFESRVRGFYLHLAETLKEGGPVTG